MVRKDRHNIKSEPPKNLMPKKIRKCPGLHDTSEAKGLEAVS